MVTVGNIPSRQRDGVKRAHLPHTRSPAATTGSRKAGSLWHEVSQFVKLCHLPDAVKTEIALLKRNTFIAIVLLLIALVSVTLRVSVWHVRPGVIFAFGEGAVSVIVSVPAFKGSPRFMWFADVTKPKFHFQPIWVANTDPQSGSRQLHFPLAIVSVFSACMLLCHNAVVTARRRATKTGR